MILYTDGMEPIVSLIADWLMLPVVVVAIYALLFKVSGGHRYNKYTRIFMAGISSYLIAKFVGYIWQPSEKRPFEMLGVEPGASFLNNPGFPSDHMLFAVFLTLAVWYATRNKWLAVLMCVMAIAVGIGRVAALVHSPLDIIGGVVIALLGAVWYVSPIESVRQMRLAIKSNK